MRQGATGRPGFRRSILKGEPVRTTINTSVDRRGGADSGDDIETILKNSLKILADASAYLDLGIDALKKLENDAADDEARKEFGTLIREANASWRMVLEMQARAGVSAPVVAPFDLEAAREEIESRLTGLAA